MLRIAPPRSAALLRAAVATCICAATPASAAAQMQIPEKFENLKVLPKDIPRDTLVQVMRTFAMSLGVRCTYCHATEPGGPEAGGAAGRAAAGAPAGGPAMERINFASDEKPT